MAGYEIYMQEMSYSKQPDDWREQANCVGYPPEWFEMIERGSPLSEGLSYAQLALLNRRNHQAAGEVCIECPVFFECRDSATEDDRNFTVRGGEPPGGRVPMCRSGKHEMSELGRCLECKKERRRESRVRVRGQAKS